MINDYRVVNDTRVIIEEKEKGQEVVENITEVNEDITGIMEKTHELMDKIPQQNWLDYAIDAVLHLSDSGISLELISASILLPIVTEYALRSEGEINCPDESQIKDFERERSWMETYIKNQFRQKYTTSDELPSPTIIDDRFSTTGLPGGTREKVFTIGRTAMQVLRAKKLVVDHAKTWTIYNKCNFDQEQEKITPPIIPSGNHNIYSMKKLEAFAQCLNPDLNMKMTDKNLAATQNRLYLELGTPAQTIIKDAIVQDSLFVLMASVTEIETSVLSSNFKSGRLRQAELYQNFLLTRNLAERNFEPGDEFTGKKIEDFLEEQETIWPNFISRNLDGLNQLAYQGDSKELDSRLRNLEPFPPTILNKGKKPIQKYLLWMTQSPQQ